MTMGVHIPTQLSWFLKSILLGCSLGLFYDLARPLRRLGGGLWRWFLDVAVVLGGAAALFFFVMSGDGELQVFTVLGALGGMVLFFCLLSRALRPVWDFWLAVFLAPMEKVEKFLRFLWKICKKLFSFCGKWFTIIINSQRRLPPHQDEGDEGMAQPKKNERKRPSSKLTGLILVILMIGIGVQLGHMRTQLRSAQAEEAVYAQRLTELQQVNARLSEDIENSDDPELVEEIARNELGMVTAGEKVFRFGN